MKRLSEEVSDNSPKSTKKVKVDTNVVAADEELSDAEKSEIIKSILIDYDAYYFFIENKSILEKPNERFSRIIDKSYKKTPGIDWKRDRSLLVEQFSKMDIKSDSTVSRLAKELKLWSDKEFVLVAIEKMKHFYESDLPKKLQKDRDINFALARKFGTIINQYKKDREFVIAAAHSGNPHALDGLSKEFTSDREIVMAAVKSCGSSLRYASDELKNDREIVLEAVKIEGCAINYASEEFKKDREIAEIAVKQNGAAFLSLSKEFENDRELLKIAVQGCPSIIEKLPFAIKNDREIIMLALEKDGNVIKYASADLRNDKQVVMKAVQQNPTVLPFLPFEMRNDPEIKELHNLLTYRKEK